MGGATPPLPVSLYGAGRDRVQGKLYVPHIRNPRQDWECHFCFSSFITNMKVVRTCEVGAINKFLNVV
jgi:hypothetical protein